MFYAIFIKTYVFYAVLESAQSIAVLILDLLVYANVNDIQFPLGCKFARKKIKKITKGVFVADFKNIHAKWSD